MLQMALGALRPLREAWCAGTIAIGMGAKTTYTRLLDDDEMKTHLERQDTLIFEGLGREWQQVERQVERLGFGEAFIVSQRGSKAIHTRVAPAEAR